jgi:hypothetical protein
MDSYDKKEPDYQTTFAKKIDNLVILSEYDPELADGIKWLDQQAQKSGISFYEMVFNVLCKHEIKKKANTWLKEKSDDSGYKNRN